MNAKNEIMNEELDVVKVFNTILESVADNSNFNHDRYLRFAFAEPKRMAELLELYEDGREVILQVGEQPEFDLFDHVAGSEVKHVCLAFDFDPLIRLDQ